MKILNKYINPKIILSILLGIALIGMFMVLFAVNKMNTLLNADLGFEKDSIFTLKTSESKVILPDTLVFSSGLPGFDAKQSIEIKSEYQRKYLKLNRQFISENYFEFFNYNKLCEKQNYFLDHGAASLIYLNESAVKALGIYNTDDAVGTRLLTKNCGELLVCGVVQDFVNLNPFKESKPVIYQLSGEHLTYAFFNNADDSEIAKSDQLISFQQRIQYHYKLWEDIIYSTFLFINVIILLVCLGFIGSKFARRKEKQLYQILGIGIHILTLVISKTYLYLLAIVGFVAGPLALLIQKFWLGVYAYRVHFGLIDLFIILSMSLLTVYLVCCPKKKLEKQLRGKAIRVNPI